MTPVGLDLSLTSTGVSVESRQFLIKSKLKGTDRMIDLREQLRSTLQAIDSPLVLLEGFSYNSRNSHAHDIGGWGWIARVMLAEEGIRWGEMAPTARAKLGSGNGNASKPAVISAVSARTGIVWSGAGADDMCDAFLLEEALWCRMGKARYNWPKVNLEALDKVDWANVGM